MRPPEWSVASFTTEFYLYQSKRRKRTWLCGYALFGSCMLKAAPCLWQPVRLAMSEGSVCLFVSGPCAQLCNSWHPQKGEQQLCLGEAPGPWGAGLGSSSRAGGTWDRGGGQSYFHWSKELRKTTKKWCKFKAE